MSNVVDQAHQWAQHLTPKRAASFAAMGVTPVMHAREGYRFQTGDGRWLYDLHLNGGTYNLGHRHPELIDILKSALDEYDVGNHHFPSPVRAEC